MVSVALETVIPSQVSCYIMPTLDGKTFQPWVEGYSDTTVQSSTPVGGGYGVAKYLFDTDAFNHTIAIIGGFHLTSFVLQFFPTDKV
jgi:hypothetical protein